MLDILLKFVVKYVIARFQYANGIPQESLSNFSLYLTCQMYLKKLFAGGEG